MRTGNICSIGHMGWKRQNFFTLNPNEPLVREISFLQNAIGIMNRMGDEGGEFLVKLRDVKLWWCEDTVEEIFGDIN